MKKVNVAELMNDVGIATSFEDEKIYISVSASKKLRAHDPVTTMNYTLMKMVSPSFKEVNIIQNKVKE